MFSTASVFPTGLGIAGKASPLSIEAGQSIRIEMGHNGEPHITWHPADSGILPHKFQ